MNDHHETKFPKFNLILVAGGKGARMESAIPKAFLKVAGKSLLAHCCEKFTTFNTLQHLIIVLPKEMTLDETDVTPDPRIKVCAGGQWRSQSVYHGLLTLNNLMVKDDDWILVHDSARPAFAIADIENLLTTLQNHPVGGILATPVTDTLKRCDQNNNILETVSRKNLWQAQTPQMFRFHLLFKVLSQVYSENNHYQIDNFDSITDEAYLMETYLKLTPQIVAAQFSNMKVTYPQDLKLLAASKLIEEEKNEEMKDWDVTLNDGLENESW